MNEQQLMHQRNLLSNMGIDIWVPRDAIVCENSASQFWRDEVISEEIELEDKPVFVNEHHSDIAQKEITLEVKKDVALKIDKENSIDIAQEQEIVIEPFVLSAFVSSKIIIFINTFDLLGDERQLLNSLVTTLSLSQYDLRWPILESLQDQKFLSIYIKGFVDIRSKADTQMSQIFLGEKPNGILLEGIQEFASLKEMIDMPNKKKILWEYLKSV
ncbi:hypothetical protein [Acinetobacter nectaris]|uniref:hypothetical protein n=1 Tax=Acinetobacter nectaris TaxID=1219382 RepID=UPI001F17D209|nr:hypothetical protein [Acinetobacter nectaris]MCF9045414.1 hypothetical protein [Acinetobacter nectaris]